MWKSWEREIDKILNNWIIDLLIDSHIHTYESNGSQFFILNFAQLCAHVL